MSSGLEPEFWFTLLKIRRKPSLLTETLGRVSFANNADKRGSPKYPTFSDSQFEILGEFKSR
jgi:hypothetical protein